MRRAKDRVNLEVCNINCYCPELPFQEAEGEARNSLSATCKVQNRTITDECDSKVRGGVRVLCGPSGHMTANQLLVDAARHCRGLPSREAEGGPNPFRYPRASKTTTIPNSDHGKVSPGRQVSSTEGVMWNLTARPSEEQDEEVAVRELHDEACTS